VDAVDIATIASGDGSIAVEIPGSIAIIHHASYPRWVGFGRSFGVKLGVLWADDGAAPPISDGGKRFK
jgi:hypothetical protein